MAAGFIPVIDLFAGPGGLGEGFSRYEPRDGRQSFKITLSIEKDERAHETLLLRSFFRQSPARVPDEYYEFLRGEIAREELFERYPANAAAAQDEAWLAELGKTDPAKVRRRIKAALGDSDPWVLIGGPPCQAYSVVGRSRNKGNLGYKPEKDHRQYLYIEYLQIIADHWPAIFVMENVKGILSAAVDEQLIFDRILEDLESPKTSLKREHRRNGSNGRYHTYKIYSVIQHGLFDDVHVRDYIVQAEKYGVPQARHRLILVGVRDDLGDTIPHLLQSHAPVPARDVLDGLPRLRSGLSREEDTKQNWQEALYRTLFNERLIPESKSVSREVSRRIVQCVEDLAVPRHDRGGEFIKCDARIKYKPKWFLDPRIGGVCNHMARAHMTSDLYRYLFAACFAEIEGRSPELVDFPSELHPDHDNVASALDGEMFADRFRVQLADRPSTTITSHIAKDGHYYIHYDPSQCRSLTVREAARLQTFPDNYFFCGPRTAQFAQVGNAVPPLLAHQIAAVVFDVLNRAGCC